MKKLLCTLLLLTGAAAALPACSTEPKSAADKSSLSSDVDAALSGFKNADSTLTSELNRAAGYAVFPDVGKGGFIAGGADGKGELFDHGVKVGYCDLSQATIGLQAGAQTYDELIIFKDQGALDRFKRGDYAFAANLSAVAIKPGAAGSANYSDGVAVFVRSKGGLMAEAAVGGQKFSYKPY
jgi:lipid-binding SYLF domain-containing protein